MHRQLRFKSLLLTALLLLTSIIATAQTDDSERRAWNRPVKPFRVVGNIYYVGVAGVASYLITTPEGHILMDSGFAETVPLIEDSVKKLGFKFEEIKILINSHAHFDHAGGFAELKRRIPGAKLMASEADAELLSKGGQGDFFWGDKPTFEPAKVDRTLRDKDEVRLGQVTMVARLTPGHTKGCTTWTMKVREGARELDVVFVGSTTIPGYKLIGNAQYPNIVADYAYTFQLLKSLKCDVFLAPHGSFFSLHEKRERQQKGAKTNPFIDGQGYRKFIEQTESAYHKQLREETQKGN